MILLVFLATLVGLSTVGLAERAHPPDHQAVEPCAAVSSAALAFESAVTDGSLCEDCGVDLRGAATAKS